MKESLFVDIGGGPVCRMFVWLNEHLTSINTQLQFSSVAEVCNKCKSTLIKESNNILGFFWFSLDHYFSFGVVGRVQEPIPVAYGKRNCPPPWMSHQHMWRLGDWYLAHGYHGSALKVFWLTPPPTRTSSMFCPHWRLNQEPSTTQSSSQQIKCNLSVIFTLKKYLGYIIHLLQGSNVYNVICEPIFLLHLL